jgi:hypothetical protein
MTITDESVDVSVESDEDANENENEDGGEATGRKRDRDFTKFRESHKELADYINANSGLDPLTPNQVKAVVALRSDFSNTPEQIAKREEAKRKREAEASKYAGLSDEEKKQVKAAEKVEKEAEKLEKRLADARERAKAIREGREASGADLAAAVESAQNGSEAPVVEPEDDDKPKRRIGRNR